MKRYFLMTLLVLIAWKAVDAQANLYADPFVFVWESGATYVVAENTRLNIDGFWFSDQGTLKITGNGSNAQSEITVASFGMYLHNLEVDKSANDVRLNGQLVITNELQMTSGNLDLNGSTIDFGTTGSLVNEADNKRVYDNPGGGQLLANRNLNAPAGVNIANLGAEITSSANLGNTTIRRYHQSQLLGGSSSIERFYDIFPNQNSGLNATLRFNYFDAELNGVPESNFQLYRSDDNGNTWNSFPSSTHNPTDNWVEVSGIHAFSWWTTSSSGTFPVEFLDIRASWNMHQGIQMPLVEWTTGVEEQVASFQIMRNIPAHSNLWEVVGELSPKGTRQGNQSYAFLDEQLSAEPSKILYRIREWDLNGQMSLSDIAILNSGTQQEWSFHIFPNPTSERVWINLPSFSDEKGVSVQILDSQGRILFEKEVTEKRLSQSLHTWPEGAYIVVVMIGQEVQTQTFVIRR